MEEWMGKAERNIKKRVGMMIDDEHGFMEIRRRGGLT